MIQVIKKAGLVANLSILIFALGLILNVCTAKAEEAKTAESASEVAATEVKEAVETATDEVKAPEAAAQATEVVADVAATADAATGEVALEAAEEVVEEEAPAADYSDIETLSQYHPKVYIVPLGKEMNLKVEYEHPMDFSSDNHIKQVQLEKLDGTFLGLKTYNERAKKAYAEFLINPEKADFTEVVLIAESVKHGSIKSVTELKFTPLEELPDKYNPKKARELALKRAAEVKKQMEEKGIVPGGRDKQPAAAEKKEEAPKKKKFGLF